MIMKLAELLTEDQVILNLQGQDTFEALIEMVEHLDDLGVFVDVSKDEVLDALKKREEQVSTAVGFGVAIPHIFLPNLRRITAIFALSKQGVSFQAPDGVPVHFIFLFLMPEDRRDIHLSLLANLAKFFHSSEARQSLKEVTSREEVLAIFSEKGNSFISKNDS